jgi:CBS domain-containing protein
MMLLDNYTIIPIVNNGKCAGVVSRLSIMDANLSARYSSITSRQRNEALVYG